MTSTSELLLIRDRQRARSQQRELGWSEVGDCRRRVGYRMSGVEPVNAGGSVQAVMGTAIHEAVAAAFTEVAEPGDLIEHEVRFAGILGHLDRYEAATATVVDVKTTSSRWLEHIKLHGPDEKPLWQVHGYGAALINEGMPVRRVRIDYIARDTGEEWSWEQAFNPAHVRDAVQWLKLVRDTPVGMLPRDYEPDSVFCRGCPFGGEDGGICWEGAVPNRDRRSVLFIEDPDAQKWADQLWEARETAKAARKREKEAAGALDAIRPDDGEVVAVGDRYLRWGANGLRFVSAPKIRAGEEAA